MPSGIILKGIGGFYYVMSGEAIYECKARGIFRKNDVTPLPGDRVCFSIGDEERKTGSIDEIMQRDNQLVRPSIANVSQVVIVIAVKSPPPDLLLLDKLLISADKMNISIIVCLNKIDLDENEEYNKIVNAYSTTGYKLFLTSSVSHLELDMLKNELNNHVTVFSGQSGVGKSTILNMFMNALIMKTGDISVRTLRGKHTTRHAELIPLLGGGFIVDTPGFSSYELSDIYHEDLQLYYPEFQNIKDSCRFSGCNHVNEPDCKVKEAVGAGKLDSGRYERYVELFGFLKQCGDSKYRKSNREKEKR